ncbi:MAG: carbohydrate ABC transporter permease [Anaerolineales bacterium]|nr:carbohydrate ABC transporter permease [Anaerolineales bacterium]
MGKVLRFLTRTRGTDKLHITDMLTYLYLSLGVIVMFGPVLWLVLSSFKTSAEVVKFPPRLLPYRQETIAIEGYDDPLPIYLVTLDDGSTAELAQIRRIGLERQLIDPNNPGEIIKARLEATEPVEFVSFNLDNYIEGVESFTFVRYLRNSVVVTIFATLLTLLVNSMAAFALSKYQFRGRTTIFLIMISTLMVPLSVVLVPVFLVITKVGWNNNLLGVIVPGAATPTGMFLLRQYMLTIPDELLDAARIDGASEWRIYSQIILPLAKPALAVLTIFSVMWRWNDFLWPLIVLSRSEMFTLQVGLNSFQGELNVQWHLILAMTVLTLLPITVVFAFLQKNITTGIATTGLK